MGLPLALKVMLPAGAVGRQGRRAKAGKARPSSSKLFRSSLAQRQAPLQITFV